jgi:O-antigen ligase
LNRSETKVNSRLDPFSMKTMKPIIRYLNAERFREFFLIVLFASIPFSIAGDDFAIIGLYLVTFYLFVRKRETKENQPILAGILILILGATVSSLFSDDPLASFQYFRNFWRFGLPFLIFYALRHRNFNRYLRITAVISGLIGVYAIVQFQTGLDVLRFQGLRTEYRALEGIWYAVGLFSHHLTYGGVSLLLFALFAPNITNREHTMRLRGLYAFGAVFNLAAVAVCMGRSIWLGGIMAIGCLVLFFLGIKRSLLLIAVTGLGLAVFIGHEISRDGAFFKQNAVGRRIASAVSVEANRDRLFMWQAGVDAIRDHRFLGLGPNQPERLQPYYDRIAEQHRHEFQHSARVGVHNIYLQNWLDFGLIGLLGHLLWWFALLAAIGRHLWRYPERHSDNRYLIGCLAGLAGIMTAGFFENNIRDGEVQTTIFVVMGLALILLKKKPSVATSPSSTLPRA